MDMDSPYVGRLGAAGMRRWRESRAATYAAEQRAADLMALWCRDVERTRRFACHWTGGTYWVPDASGVGPYGNEGAEVKMRWPDFRGSTSTEYWRWPATFARSWLFVGGPLLAKIGRVVDAVDGGADGWSYGLAAFGVVALWDDGPELLRWPRVYAAPAGFEKSGPGWSDPNVNATCWSCFNDTGCSRPEWATKLGCVEHSGPDDG
jgi:hypothetical protein